MLDALGAKGWEAERRTTPDDGMDRKEYLVRESHHQS
jgi:hypothetical protein